MLEQNGLSLAYLNSTLTMFLSSRSLRIFFLLSSIVVAVAASTRYPAIFIPGDGGSQLWARLNHTTPPPHFFCSRHSNWFELWLDIGLILPEVIDCFVDNMRLVYNETTKKTSNIDGVEVQVPDFGNTSTVEYFDATGFAFSAYFAPIIRNLVSLGYQRGIDLRGAP